MDKIEDPGKLLPLDIEEELKKSFISYAMAVIINRALPDVRDGLKPVHRRILHAMTELGLTSDKPFKKSVRIVGEVLGKYHPHGDTAVYDAMVRLAQDFSTRMLLVEGQGNFGSVDGDGAAAMRYTEARLSRIAGELTRDIDKETVDFYPNFDDSATQPSVLPARFPNLLVNGSSGIAVGMATNIPPHNLGEVIDGVVAMLDNPDISAVELMDIIKGPDFPTRGIIMGTSGIREAYLSGRGRVVTRARTEIEEMSNNKLRIIVTELPYMVNKARLTEKIAELVQEKRLEGISDLRDESARNGMRLVIELKKDVNPNVVLNFLFKHTSMQETFGVNMLALVDGEPRVLALKEILEHYVAHQHEVIVRRTRYDLAKAEARAHILEGLLLALDAIDRVIALIRASKTTAEARDGLMQTFGLSERQAQAILDLRLQRLTGLERDKIEAEYQALKESIAYFNAVLSDDSMVVAIIRKEILDVRARYADERRTQITAVENEIDPADLIQEKEMVVTITNMGYIKRTSLDTYRAQRRGGKGVIGLQTREEDVVRHLFATSTHCPIWFFTSRGRVHRLMCYELPEAGRQAKGTAAINLLNLEPGERISAVIPLEEDSRAQEEIYFVLATKNGLVKKTAVSEFANLRSSGLIAIVLREEDEVVGVSLATNTDSILIGTRRGMAIHFVADDEQLRPLGRATMGVRSIDLEAGDEVVDMSVCDDGCQVLSISQKGYGKRTSLEEYRLQSRAGKGIMAMRLTDKTGVLAAQMLVKEDEDIMLIADDGTIIRTPVSAISVLSRTTQGVRVMRLDEDNEIIAVARVAAQEELEEAEEADAEAADTQDEPQEGAPVAGDSVE